MAELPILTEFLTSVLVEKSGSKHTQQSYARDLAMFSEFLKDSNSRLDSFMQTKLQAFCTQRGLGRRSQARVVSTLRSYFKYLQRQGLMRQTPKLEITKHTRALPETLSAEEIERLRTACLGADTQSNQAKRNHAVLVILYATGCRVTELCSIDIADVQLDMRTLLIRGKGSKERIVPIVTEAADVLNTYFEIRVSIAHPLEKSLIVNERGNRPSRIDIFRWLKKWSLEAGFQKNVSPHTLRHACATLLLKEGVDLRSIQTLLGHASIATTEIYTKIENGDLKETVEQNHPLADS